MVVAGLASSPLEPEIHVPSIVDLNSELAQPFRAQIRDSPRRVAEISAIVEPCDAPRRFLASLVRLALAANIPYAP